MKILVMQKIIITGLILFLTAVLSFGQGPIRENFHIYSSMGVYKKVETIKKIPKDSLYTNVTYGENVKVKTKEPIFVTKQEYKRMNFDGRMIASAVKYEDKDPNYLKLNFRESRDSSFNKTLYIKVPVNDKIVIRNHHFKTSALTIPFVLRPALNDSVGTKVFTDIKLGATVSYNIDWTKYKNLRIKTKTSAVGISFAANAGISKITLDSTTTRYFKRTPQEFEQFGTTNPYIKNTQDRLSMFVAFGSGLNIRGLQIMINYGWQFGLGKGAKDWDYQGKGFWGVGFGVDLSTFAKLLN